MLDLSSEILEHLQHAGTVLVPSRQRATAVRVAFSAAMLARGRRVWNTPDVLPWAAWLERELDCARARGESVPRRLSALEQWLLWQESVHEACAGFNVLMPDAMVDPVRRAASLLEDYGLTVPVAASAEADVLQAARQHFARRCQELDATGSTSWLELHRWLRPGAHLLLAGFPAIGPARRIWLQQHGVRFAHHTWTPVAAQIRQCDSLSQEADAAAQWCAGRLAQDPSARLLIVVPQLAEQRHLWERAFFQHLDHIAILRGTGSSATATYAIEGGRPLTSYRLIATALDLIALATGHATFDELSEVLRSAYLAALDRNQSLRIERWMRERNVDTARPMELRSLLPKITRDLQDSAGAALLKLLDALDAMSPGVVMTASQWAQQWVALLERCGWCAGATLGSDEQQARMRFDELLGDFAAVKVLSQPLAADAACHRLHKMAQRVSFEPATDDVPVTLTGRLEDPIVRYDAVWVAGLTADTWPPAARPDPMLPLQMQYRAGIAQASAEGQLQQAQQLLGCWQGSARQFVCSWSHSTADVQHDRSPLIDQATRLDSDIRSESATDTFSLERWQVEHAPVLEAWSDNSVPASLVDGVLKGGTRLLELQSLCPFRAFAELRLKAAPLEQPAPGMDAGVRGKIVHRAVELFWRSIGDQATLLNTGAAALSDLTHRCVAQAMQSVVAQEPGIFPAALLRREQLRSERLIALLVDWERRRPAFAAQILESEQPQRFSGATLELRLDRVDRLEDGSLIVIDYKSGKPKKFDAFAARLPQPQLPAYAVASGACTVAVASLYLGREGVSARGLADRKDRLPRVPAPDNGEPDWTQLMRQWQQQLQSLAGEFLRGEAAVRPQPDACKFCHLQILCRIDPAYVPVSQDSDEADADLELDLDAEEATE